MVWVVFIWAALLMYMWRGCLIEAYENPEFDIESAVGGMTFVSAIWALFILGAAYLDLF